MKRASSAGSWTSRPAVTRWPESFANHSTSTRCRGGCRSIHSPASACARTTWRPVTSSRSCRRTRRTRSRCTNGSTIRRTRRCCRGSHSSRRLRRGSVRTASPTRRRWPRRHRRRSCQAAYRPSRRIEAIDSQPSSSGGDRSVDACSIARSAARRLEPSKLGHLCAHTPC